MAVPLQAVAIPKEITATTVILPHKPTAAIACSYVSGTDPAVLVVFLNGLMTDKSSWTPVISGIIHQRKSLASPEFPSMLAYDRYGVGMTEDRDPLDQGREQGHGHDCKDAAEDLHYLIQHFSQGLKLLSGEKLRVVLVANSIGCAIARLYAERYLVAAVLFLDSIMANSDFDFWPDPDAPGFDKRELPDDVTVEVLREQRAKFAAIFRPDVVNREGLSRRSLARLLPHSDGPMLGNQSGKPWVTVVGHDFEAFANESLRTMGTPIGLSMRYMNPMWHKYNQGLVHVTDREKSKGPIVAKGCGHFIQRDDPDFVIRETLDLVDKVRMQQSVVW
ncbi:hypothetical protein HO173_002415 [Letharia columbiana]|uniref:AB hydrolase-1 domain-containing protein n=1 Tax=Letharia columbiana TaxID=112416 RepID=A0A8H6G3H2_9LECA|nr:uncharacterized protein HO173_002415 [Letharia columbiana]KAF6239868.1 hypothetical protein HO173_002415 [Letharia columbiana]